MKYILFILSLFTTEIVSAQYVTDTFQNPSSWSPTVPIFSNHRIRSITKFRPNELLQKGILPGCTIYGMAYNKANFCPINPGVPATFNVKMRSGDFDSIAPNYMLFSPMYWLNNSYTDSFFFGGFPTGNMFTNGVNFNYPQVGWFPLMFDVPFIYMGGVLDICTYWQTPPNSFSLCIPATPPVLYTQYGFNGNVEFVVMDTLNANLGYVVNSANSMPYRAANVIYHTPPPPPCSGFPNAGSITGQYHVCVNKSFTLYLNNASAGPGISYQWQKSAISPISWSNIAGATQPTLTTSISSPTQYKCVITCTNSGHTATTPAFITQPHHLHIDSLSVDINFNSVLFIPHVSDSLFGFVSTAFYLNSTMSTGNSVNFNIDSTYHVIYVASNTCNADTIYKTFTIGCQGSPSFHDTIISSQHSCPGKQVTLSIQDTLPSNYTVEWQAYINWNWVTINGFNGATASVNPTSNTIYRNVATCTLSTNFKYSNLDTVWVTPPPTAGTIQATNTTTNYYNFTNNGMSNAQTYKWFFGDGDSSTSLAPSHHYNLAGTYTVTFVVTNAGNGCTDTAFTTVNITTGVEEIPNNSFSITPNPAQDNCTISYHQAGSLVLIDASGKKVGSWTLEKNKNTQTIDINYLSNGVYIAEYKQGEQVLRKKLVKE